tara:strand:+ start:6399 stop:6944 length:546 start_codon:yes stop_codon:yes gene_type:complete
VLKSIFILIIFYSHLVNAQENATFKRQISVDGTYLISVLKTEEKRITPFNIKFHLNKKYYLRTGFNINNSTSSNKGFEGDFKIGFETPNKLSEKWKYYYGTDFNSTYKNYNDRENTTTIFSLLPLIGFEVNIVDEFSLSYEPRIIFSYKIFKDPDSFYDRISYEKEIKLTGLSQFFINFNF